MLEMVSEYLQCRLQLLVLIVRHHHALQTHYVEMRSDGINIATDVMLPTINVQEGQKLPAVFFQTR